MVFIPENILDRTPSPKPEVKRSWPDVGDAEGSPSRECVDRVGRTRGALPLKAVALNILGTSANTMFRYNPADWTFETMCEDSK